MLKRVLALLAAVSVLVSSASGYEWTGESFLQDYYGVSPASAGIYAISEALDWVAPQSDFVYDVSPQADGDSMTSVSGQDFFTSLSLLNNSSYLFAYYHFYSPGTSLPGVSISPVSLYNYKPLPESGFSFSPFRFESYYPLEYVSYGVPVTISKDLGATSSSSTTEVLSVLFPVMSNYSSYSSGFDNILSSCNYSFDISSFGEFSSFELSGLFYPLCSIWLNGSFVFNAFSSYIVLSVNGRDVKNFYPDSSGIFDFAHFWYDAGTSISSVQFRIYFRPSAYSFPSGVSSATFQSNLYFRASYSPTFTILTDDEAFNNAVNDANNAINDYDNIESEWTANMNSSYDALNLDSFSFDGSFVSAVHLVTGIFQDIWTALGGYAILFTIPLMSGIALMVVGRVSRHVSDRSTTGKKG